MTLAHLADTSRAFDAVANEYDGSLGNNALIQRMRAQVIARIVQTFPAPARLLDLGCGTGLDATELAKRGFEILAIDSSPAMIGRTRARICASGIDDPARALCFGIHELDQLREDSFDGLYSNFGPLNCVPDLKAASREMARLLKPGGKIIASVIGKYCWWEIALYALRRDWTRARIRFSHDLVAVSLREQTIWTRYYTPREFYRAFESEFELIKLQAMNLFMPPPYLIHTYERHFRIFSVAAFLDDRLSGMPFLRNFGDHFLIELKKRD